MYRVILFLLADFCFLTQLLFSEEKDVVVILHPKAGIYINKELNEQHFIFPEISGFISAIIVMPYDRLRYYAYIIYLDDNDTQETIKWLDVNELEEYTRRIGNDDTLSKNSWKYIYDYEITRPEKLSFEYGRKYERRTSEFRKKKELIERSKNIGMKNIFEEVNKECELCSRESWIITTTGKKYKNSSIFFYKDSLSVISGFNEYVIKYENILKMIYKPEGKAGIGMALGGALVGLAGAVIGGKIAYNSADRNKFDRGGGSLAEGGLYGGIAGAFLGICIGGYISYLLSYDLPHIEIDLSNINSDDKLEVIRAKISLFINK